AAAVGQAEEERRHVLTEDGGIADRGAVGPVAGEGESARGVSERVCAPAVFAKICAGLERVVAANLHHVTEELEAIGVVGAIAVVAERLKAGARAGGDACAVKDNV